MSATEPESSGAPAWAPVLMLGGVLGRVPTRRRWSGGRCPVAVTLVFMAAVASACSGGSEQSSGSEQSAVRSPSSTAAVSSDRWRAELGERCSQLNADHADLAAADPLTSDEAIDYARAVDDFAEALLAAVRAAPALEGSEDDVERLVALMGRLERSTTALVATAEHADADGMASATESIRRFGRAVNPLTVELGVPECGGL